jgi:hypothetical protein
VAHKTIFLTKDAPIYKYLEGYNDNLEHKLENASLTKNLSNRIEKVPSSDAKQFPITEFSTGFQNRPEFVIAIIRKSHLDSGEKTSKNEKLCKEIAARGDGSDDVGHIIGNQLGGPMRNYNLYPQNPSINRGHWKSVEDTIVKWLRSGKYSDTNIEYQARLVYENERAMRPEGMHFLVKFKVGNRIATLDELNKVDASIEGPIDSDYLPNPSSSKKYRTQGEDYVSK